MEKDRKLPELLAPAGNYESFLGAIRAGADAVYLGGDRFGARAYAENFTAEEICSAVSYAHIFGRKVYLTVNTLCKEREMQELYGYLLPFYEAGLDGIIVQDIGVLRFCREHFPGLELHISTQMTVTGSLGAKLLQEAGAVRLVPARELSLKEIRQIKAETGMQIETFIHGALCYCYSGQCLFSSMLGGRSGNRGRCAQPCRLPYTVKDGQGNTLYKGYPLSLKDLCTIDDLPALIEAGIDSFKIEGRMKRPEYAAGVTAIYRRYMDAYANDPKHYQVSAQDREKLAALYVRSGLHNGYYNKHNGAEMITPEKPSYSGNEEQLLAEIRNTYLAAPLQREVKGQAVVTVGGQAALTLNCGSYQVTAWGDPVEKADKQPLSEETIRKQLTKTGNERFRFADLSIETDGASFLPVKALNSLRREAFALLEQALLKPFTENRKAILPAEADRGLPESIMDGFGKAIPGNGQSSETGEQSDCREIYVSLLQPSQIDALPQTCLDIKRLYLSTDCLSETGDPLKKESGSHTTPISYELPVTLRQYLESHRETELYISLPYVIRNRDRRYLEPLKELLLSERVAGVLARNLETLAWLKEAGYRAAGKRIVLDANVYTWNRESCRFWQDFADGYTAPLECNKKVLEGLPEKEKEIIVYGRIPMMLTANCVYKTSGGCQRKMREEEYRSLQTAVKEQLRDRYQTDFPVYRNCRFCMNVIYNSVPLSLHQSVPSLKGAVRLEFTTENPEETLRILEWYGKLQQCAQADFPVTEFTTGHYKKGAQ